MRVWVPFQRRKTIGMVVKVHQKKPSFNTRYVERVLDREPILSSELLDLTCWVHQFYYCGWGEVIQAALPAGLNFHSQTFIRVSPDAATRSFSPKEQEIIEEIEEAEKYPLDEAQKRWTQSPYSSILKNLIKEKVLEVWEEPVENIQPKTEKVWHWKERGQEKAATILKENEAKSYKWLKALQQLATLELPKSHKKLTESDLLDNYTLNRIAKEGIIKSRQEEVKGFELD